MSDRNTILAILCTGMIICYSICGIFLQKSEFTASQSVQPDKVRLPSIMYHMVLDDKNRLGKFVISPQEFENDMKYLKDNGYESVVFEDLYNFVQNGKPLPKKPILITFDDGYYNNYLFAYPILKKYGFKAVLSIIGKESEKYSESGERSKYYSHMTWEDIKNSTDIFEIQNHSYNLHKYDNLRSGAKKRSDESPEAYKKMLTEDLQKNATLIKEKTELEVNVFTFPFGSMCSDAHEVLKAMGYIGSLSCEEGINYITRNSDSIFKLKRYNRPSGQKSEVFFAFLSE